MCCKSRRIPCLPAFHNIKSSFLVIHKVGNVDIFVLVKFENKIDKKISHWNCDSKYYDKCQSHQLCVLREKSTVFDPQTDRLEILIGRFSYYTSGASTSRKCLKNIENKSIAWNWEPSPSCIKILPVCLLFLSWKYKKNQIDKFYQIEKIHSRSHVSCRRCLCAP